MEKLFNLAKEHKEVIAKLYIAKTAIKLVFSVVLIAVLISTISSFRSIQENISEAQEQVHQTANYLTGISEDTTDVPESFIAVKADYEQAKEDIANFSDSFSEYRQSMVSDNDSPTPEK